MADRARPIGKQTNSTVFLTAHSLKPSKAFCCSAEAELLELRSIRHFSASFEEDFDGCVHAE